MSFVLTYPLANITEFVGVAIGSMNDKFILNIEGISI